jgi:hypothetical protein
VFTAGPYKPATGSQETADEKNTRPADTPRMLTAGTEVQIHLPDTEPAALGRVVGFYCNEPRRAIVVLPSGESLVVMETDVSPVDD